MMASRFGKCAIVAVVLAGVGFSSPDVFGDYVAYRNGVLALSPEGFWSVNQLSGTTIPDVTANARNLTLGSDTASWNTIADGPMAGAMTSVNFTPYPHGDSRNTYSGIGAYGLVSSPGPFTWPNGFTIEMWVKSIQTGVDWGVVWGHRGYALGMNVDGRPHFVTWGALDYVSSTVVPRDTWAMVDVVFDGTKADFYVNGAYSDTVTATTNAFMGGSDVFGMDHRMRLFDQDANTYNQPYFGAVNQVAVFHSLLTGAQIQANYENAVAAAIPEPSTLVLLGVGGLLMLGFARRMRRRLRLP